MRFGLGWALNPGVTLLIFIVVLAMMKLRRVPAIRLLAVVLCLLTALFLEYLPLPRPIDSFIGIALTLLGLGILFNSAR